MSFTPTCPVWQVFPPKSPKSFYATIHLFAQWSPGRILAITSSRAGLRRAVCSHPEAGVASDARVRVVTIEQEIPKGEWDAIVCEVAVPSERVSRPAWLEALAAARTKNIAVVERVDRRKAPGEFALRARAKEAGSWVQATPTQAWDKADSSTFYGRKLIRGSWGLPPVNTVDPCYLFPDATRLNVTDVDGVDYSALVDLQRIRAGADRLWIGEGRSLRRVRELEAWAGSLTDADVLAELKCGALTTLRTLYEPEWALAAQRGELHPEVEQDRVEDDEHYAADRLNPETRRDLLTKLLAPLGWAPAVAQGHPVVSDRDTCAAIRSSYRSLYQAVGWLAYHLVGQGRSGRMRAMVEDRTGAEYRASVATDLLSALGYTLADAATAELVLRGEISGTRPNPVSVWIPRVLKASFEQPYSPNSHDPPRINADFGELENDLIDTTIKVVFQLPKSDVEPAPIQRNLEISAGAPGNIADSSEQVLHRGCIPAFTLDLAAWESAGCPKETDGLVRREPPYLAVKMHTVNGIVSIPDPANRKGTEANPEGRRQSNWPSMPQAYVQNVSKTHRRLLRALPGRTLVSMDLHAAHVHIAVALARPLDCKKVMQVLLGEDPYSALAAATGCTRDQAKVVLLAAINGGGATLDRLPGATPEVAKAVDSALKRVLSPWHKYAKALAPETAEQAKKERRANKDAPARARSRGALAMQKEEAALLERILKAVAEQMPELRLLVPMYDGALWDTGEVPDLARLDQTIRGALVQKGYKSITPVIGTGSTWSEAEGKAG